MRITIPTTALHAAMSATAQAVAGRMPEDRLAHLTAHDNTLTAHAGGALGTTITATVDADVPTDHPTSTTYVPHSFLHEIAEHMRKISDTVTLDLTDDAGVHLTARHRSEPHEFTARINREIPPAGWTPPDTTPALTLDTTREALLGLLTPEYAVAREPFDSTLGGAYLDGQDGHLTLVGTNGTRLALADQALDGEDVNSVTGRALSRAATTAIRRALELAGAPACRVTINAARSHLTVTADAASPRITITVALREATSFPQYRRILPTVNAALTIRVNREALLAVVNRLKPLTLAGANALTVTASEHEGDITLAVDVEGQHSATERLSVAEGVQEPVGVRVNAAYLADALAHYRSTLIDWQLSNPVMSVRGVDDVDAGRLDVIAQLRSP